MRNGVFMVAVTLGGLGGGSGPARAGDATTTQAATVDYLAPLVTEGVVNAPVAEVWKVFSTAEGFKKMGVAKCELDLRIGGLIRTHYNPQGVLGDEGTIQNEILAFEPERMIAFRIHQPPKNFPFAEATWKSTWSVVLLTDLGERRTHVRLAGLGYTDTEESRKMRQFFESGNAWVMQHLQQQFDSTAPASTRPAHASDPLAPIVHERVLELSRPEVWKLLATGAGWKQFLGAEARIELHPGGPFEILFDASAPAGRQGSEGCTVLSVIPDELLSYTWNAPPKFEHARAQHTWVVVRLDELAPARTRVRIDHQGFAEQAADHPEHRAEWEEVRAYFQSAWGKVLDALKAQESLPSARGDAAAGAPGTARPPGR
jgi:uncharacterized protein YndB with AHSA1/START domain